MQTRATISLARKLVRSHRKTGSWRKTALEHGIVTPSGGANPAMAQRIALSGYEPVKPSTRRRLGLPEICVECHRPVPKSKVAISSKRLSSWKRLDELTHDELVYAFVNRVVLRP